MTIKSFVIAAAAGLVLLAAIPASAHRFAEPTGRSGTQYSQGQTNRQYIPIRRIFRIIRRYERREWRREYRRRQYRQNRQYRYRGHQRYRYDRRYDRRYYN
jgi:hypothetical protein